MWSNWLVKLLTKGAFVFGVALGGITGINWSFGILCGWLFGKPKAPLTPRRPPAQVRELSTVLEEQNETVAAESQDDPNLGSVDHGRSSGTVETHASQASLARELSTVLQEQDDTVAAERQEDTEHGSHAESSSSPTLQEAALLQYYAKVEQSILLQIRAKSDLVIANLKQCIQLQNNLRAGRTWINNELSALKPGQQSSAALTSYGAYLDNLRLQIELKKEEICRLNKEKEILEKAKKRWRKRSPIWRRVR